MTNWACGLVSITGTKQNVTNFARRFVCNSEIVGRANPKLRYFDRSSTISGWQELLNEISKTFNGSAEKSECTFVLQVEFAWDANNCMLYGYPPNFPNECITLMDASKADHVSVSITIEVSSNTFVNRVDCEKHGHTPSKNFDFLTYKCPACRSVTKLASLNGEYICPDCGGPVW